MIKTLKNHYRRTPSVAKLLFGILFFLGMFTATFRFIHADTIPFQGTLSTMFPRLNTGYYSNTYFKFGGNDFVGIIFWQTGLTLGTPEVITINSGAQAIQCTEKLRGIYYNNQRGRRIWPLDTDNLSILSGQGSGYDSMTMTNGFFTQCSALSGGYIPAANDVYGQIDHILTGGQTFRMIAGVTYDFTGNEIISGTSFSGTLKISTGGIHTGFIFDQDGGIAQLSMNVPWCQNFEVSPTIIVPQGGETMFLCQAQNTNSYILQIRTTGGTLIYSDRQYPSDPLNAIRTTGSALATGDYIASCTIVGSGGLGGPQCGVNTPFHVGSGYTPPSGGTGCSVNFQGETTFSAITGSVVINPLLGTYFTNKTGIFIQWAATQPTDFTISGDFAGGGILTGFSPWSNIFNFSYGLITLNYTNTWNYFSTTFTTGGCTYVDASKRVYVDTLAPTAPVITTPTSGGITLCPSSPLTVTRTASSDGSGSQVAYYKYEIYNNNGMTTGLMLSGNTTSTTVLPNISLLPLGTYYIRVLAVDNIGMISSGSDIVSFTTSPQYCPAGTGVIIVTPVIWLRNVNLDTVYRSDPIIILGLTGPTLVSISKGMLFINNHTGGNGTTGMVSSVDTINIELVSSNEYNTTVSSNLSVLGLTGVFSVTTKSGNCVLSAGEKLVIQNIYANLKDQYNNDLSKLSDFLHTFQSMVQDEADLTNSCTLAYLLQLIEDDLGFDGSIDTSNHITPNCKEYSIGYDATQRAYYAPETISRYYFINRESLIRHLDYYNPGDCHINTYVNNIRTTDTTDPMKHIAPNGKIYHLIGQYGGFSATEFTSAKYFDSMESIVRYIDLRNPPKEIWKHTLDIAFIPITYAAPNGKEYKIYKTDRGYMSYKLMKVRYYGTIGDLKNYINANNPSKW